MGFLTAFDTKPYNVAILSPGGDFMTLNSYLYTFVITGVCLVLMLSFLTGYALNRSRSTLLMALLYGVYVFSELARNLTMLAHPDRPYTPSVLVGLCCLLMELLYGLILWDQAKRPVSKRELIVLIVFGTFNAVLALTPTWAVFSDILFVYIFLWGAFKLWPVRRRDKRTGVLFALTVSFFLLNLAFSLVDLLLWPNENFSYTSFFLTTLSGELMFYVIIGASVVDLVFLFRAMRHKSQTPAIPETSPVQAIAAQFALSPREQDVLALIAQGKSAREIGQELFISEGTVKVHTHNIYQKLGISSRRQVYQLMMEYQTGQKS